MSITPIWHLIEVAGDQIEPNVVFLFEIISSAALEASFFGQTWLKVKTISTKRRFNIAPDGPGGANGCLDLQPPSLTPTILDISDAELLGAVASLPHFVQNLKWDLQFTREAWPLGSRASPRITTKGRPSSIPQQTPGDCDRIANTARFYPKPRNTHHILKILL